METGTIRRYGVRRPWVFVAPAVAAWLLGWGTIAAPAAVMARSLGSIKAIPGWPGGLKTFEGRYRLIMSSEASLAKSGMLTIFARTVPHQPKPQMSGILALYTTSGTNVLYLTHFVHTRGKLSAQINMGIYTGPKIGTFALMSHRGAALVARFVPLQGAAALLRFTRISTNPHP